jgi:glycosyltransferase involved in cell wall biosynthesis
LTKIADNKKEKISFQFGDPFLICLTGSISVKKEGLIDLLNALAILKRKGVDFILNLYGSGDAASLKEIEKFASYNDMHNNIKLHGSIPHTKVPEVLHKHHLLVMTRRANLQSEYGFSTKLAEYLGSGTATLVTDVSDNKLFIEDEVNGFLAAPGSVFGLADKLFEIYQRNDLVEIGMKGRQTAENHFDYHHYKDILYHFFFK